MGGVTPVRNGPSCVGYKQNELIAETLLSAKDQEKFALSIVLPEEELKNFK